ncbi:MAG: hypothetical protein AB9869_13965 [Verrucomicrobiia bacterium]
MSLPLDFLGVVCLSIPACSRLIWLAPTPLGWVNYLANLFCEVVFKKIRLQRFTSECVLVFAGSGLLLASGSTLWVVLACAVLLLILDLAVRQRERHLLMSAWTHLDPMGPSPAPGRTRGLAVGYPAPSTHPDLTLTLVGPFTSREPRYQLGTMVLGRRFTLELLIGNHTLVPTQTPVRVQVSESACVAVGGSDADTVGPLQPGQVARLELSASVRAAGGPGSLSIEVAWGHLNHRICVDHGACMPPSSIRISSAQISRYPGARRSAFTWRGDMDLYDTSTLQSVEGLLPALQLGARYRIPQTMFLSTRLSLDQDEAESWAQHYGIDRGAKEIPRFIRWMKENVEFCHSNPYPLSSDKPFALELGNHGHLHYGTDAAASAHNGWKPKARMGAGIYPWIGRGCSSLEEQQRNALETARLITQCFGMTPRSWAMPDRTNDSFTAQAMEQAGCEVLSGSDARPSDNVIFQPPPHHPPGTRCVELTNRYPGDPKSVYHVAMLEFWMHRAHRLGIPMIFMCHQHLRQFAGHACARFTEAILRHALSAFNGDLFVDTVFGVGKYWREVLSETTARVRVSLTGNTIVVENRADLDLSQVPIDLAAGDGRTKFTLLLDVQRGYRSVFDACTGALISAEQLAQTPSSAGDPSQVAAREIGSGPGGISRMKAR